MTDRQYLRQLKSARRAVIRDYFWNIRGGYYALARKSLESMDELTKRIDELESA